MDDQKPKHPQSISEISHLFLSDLRDKQTNGADRPVRTPPGARKEEPSPKPPVSIDLTPEEYAEVFATGESTPRESGAEVRIPPVTALIAQHLNGRADQRVRAYARHLAANGERVGLLEVDSGEVRLSCFERSIEPTAPGETATTAEVTPHFNARFITEALEEMSWDLDRWLLVLPNLRSSDSRDLLKQADHWTLLSTCDHDGVVSCYRTLKGLAAVHKPHALTLALMESTNETHAAKISRKLSSVCLQFLGIELSTESTVRPTQTVAEHVVVHCQLPREDIARWGGTHWVVVSDFLARARGHEATTAVAEVTPAAAPKGLLSIDEEMSDLAGEAAAPAADPLEHAMPESSVRDERQEHVPSSRAAAAPASPAPISTPAPVASAASTEESIGEVIDLPDGDADEESVLTAILAGSRGELIECPVRAPMCTTARLAVTRERGLVILAVARKGLSELRSIAHAYRWLVENRALIGMAVPQLAIDGHRHPRLRLLVDHADLTAEALAPMLESNTVSVQAYRKLRWGNKTGLLLEAA
jgi:hypothetical protein